MDLVNIFFYYIDYHFVLLIVSFALLKILSFMRTHLLIIDLSACTVDVLFRKPSSVPVSSRLFSLSLLSDSVCLVLC